MTYTWRDAHRFAAVRAWVRGPASLQRWRRRKWCFESAPGYHGAGHSCHLRTHHKGPHLANLCGAGHRGGRKIRWTSYQDVRITGKGIGKECWCCTWARKRGDHPNVRIMRLS